MTNKSEYLGAAFRAALLAGDFITQNLGKISRDDITIKQASDFVTHIDRESEQIIIKTIKDRFPAHKFLAEESLKDTSSNEYRWIIDPLDGTTNYIHSYPMFSISIALELKSEIILAVVYDPLRDEVFTAEKGQGAFLNGKRISVSSNGDISHSLVSTGFPFRKKELIDSYLTLFKNIFSKVSDIRRTGSAALDLAHVACGRCEGFFELALSPWDIAAGSLLIQEAGGIVTDFRGGDNYMTTGNVLAAAPSIHVVMLSEARTVFQGLTDQ